MVKCIQCGLADLLPTLVRLQGSVRGEQYTVETQGLECPNCHYKTIDGAAMPEFSRLLSDRYRANHGLLTSDEIKERRNKLGMTQQQFAQHLGVGIASVKRWEMGKIQEPHSNDLILRESGSHSRNLAEMCYTLTSAGNTATVVLTTQTPGNVAVGLIQVAGGLVATSVPWNTAKRGTVLFASPVSEAEKEILA